MSNVIKARINYTREVVQLVDEHKNILNAWSFKPDKIEQSIKNVRELIEACGTNSSEHFKFVLKVLTSYLPD